jgi:hypothetical protein
VLPHLPATFKKSLKQEAFGCGVGGVRPVKISNSLDDVTGRR